MAPSIKIPSVPGMGRTIIQHDPRSKDFAARTLLGMPISLSRHNQMWKRGLPYDQGQTSICVAETGKGLLNTTPNSRRLPYHQRSRLDVMELYHGAQRLDQWPGENYDGTSALGLCKYLLSMNLIKEYRWCFSVDDVIDTLVNLGPVGIGVKWMSNMMDTDANGFVHATGSEVGGHEVEINSVNISDKYFGITNSWGSNWGIKGRCKLSWDDLTLLLADSGDAVTFVR